MAGARSAQATNAPRSAAPSVSAATTSRLLDLGWLPRTGNPDDAERAGRDQGEAADVQCRVAPELSSMR